jgi:hypothetical protein
MTGLWALAADRPGPLSALLVEPMRRALNDERRTAILLLKEARAAGAVSAIASIDLYRAVLMAELGPDVTTSYATFAAT